MEELVWHIVTIVGSTLIGCILLQLIPPYAILQFYTMHATARHIEKKCSCCLRWTAFLFHVFAYLTARLLQLYGWLMHSYEIVGLENIPTDRPVLLIFYHGVMPVDLYYLIVQLYFKREYSTVLRVVLDRVNFVVPCWEKLVQNYTFPGPAAHCVDTLTSGHSLIIAPGGMRESLFATRKYETLWNSRAGFARVAREAKVDIIPVFTRNIRQNFILPEWAQRLARPLYEKRRIVAVLPIPIVFPVKLVSYVGTAIPYDCVHSAEELAKYTNYRIDTMIAQYQTFPATTWRGILERFTQVRPLQDSLVLDKKPPHIKTFDKYNFPV